MSDVKKQKILYYIQFTRKYQIDTIINIAEMKCITSILHIKYMSNALYLDKSNIQFKIHKS